MDQHPSRALVLAPHQDDEVLGCGGFLAALADCGWTLVVASAGIKVVSHRIDWKVAQSYRHQLLQACGCLGVQGVICGDFETERFEENKQGLRIWIQEVVHCVVPDLVLFPWHGDLHPDHQTLSEAARFSLRGFDPVCPTRALMYEIPGSSGFGTEGFQPSVWVPLSRENMARKLAAFDCYPLEQRPEPHPRSQTAIMEMARIRGRACGQAYAEAFIPYRELLFPETLVAMTASPIGLCGCDHMDGVLNA